MLRLTSGASVSVIGACFSALHCSTVQQNLCKFTVSDAVKTHIKLFLHPCVIRGSFKQNMPYLFFPSWPPTARPRPVRVHYKRVAEREWINRDNLKHRYCDK